MAWRERRKQYLQEVGREELELPEDEETPIEYVGEFPKVRLSLAPCDVLVQKDLKL